MFNQISMADFLQRRADGWQPYILDVRSDAEHADLRVDSCDLQIPHTSIHSVLDELPKKTDIVIYCKSGMRSQLAAIELIKYGWFGDRLYNLEGGIMAWQAAAPSEIVR